MSHESRTLFDPVSSDVESPASRFGASASGRESGYFVRYTATRRKITWVAVFGGTFVAVLAITTILVAVNSSPDGMNFPHFGPVSISGTYRLNKCDANYDRYLSSIDIPSIVIQIIKASKEIITVQEPTNSNPNWTLTLRTEYSVHVVSFRMDEAFHVAWEKDTHIEHRCTRPSFEVIMCTTREPVKGWNLRSRMIFTAGGMIDEKFNLYADVATNKTYVRIKDDENESIAAEEANLASNTEAPPFDNDDDWFIWE